MCAVRRSHARGPGGIPARRTVIGSAAGRPGRAGAASPRPAKTRTA